jgi:hypothetical protein
MALSDSLSEAREAGLELTANEAAELDPRREAPLVIQGRQFPGAKSVAP